MAKKVRQLQKSEIAAALGVSRWTVYRWLESKELRGITLKDVVEFVRRSTQS